ncbi:MAG TPA: CRISPR-associated endoribonuclease Cas6 [Chitinophaga sp.]|uniref:CRISPR-associated endoribonuclease Cas6 n=1 Tax=Chitinophaga sp. TaxID=1869181 RepID=UPI002C3A5B91|nr:CRISPR-associated endoribonuclease Cas6 [Chitinophaga sp.]HVI45183.1 CRISPR-associated endoribonuclease Cas6 [Chitinophaga sp.]
MRLSVTISSSTGNAVIPINYAYPISAVIYKILSRADKEYADFLHEKGYAQANSLKAFKLFSCSDINTPFKIVGDRLHLLTTEAVFKVSFHIPQAAESFVKGLFLQQKIEIADRSSRADFIVSQVELLPPVFPEALERKEIHELLLHPLSPVVCGFKKDTPHYKYLSPEDTDFVWLILHNWKEKYTALYGSEKAAIDFADADLEVILYNNPPKARLVTIKAGTPAETKVRGYTNFRMLVRGRQEVLELLLDTGVGLYNSLCMGAVEGTYQRQLSTSVK